MNRRHAAAATICAISVLVTGCGGESRKLAGFTNDPVPDVGDVTLPDLTDAGDEFALTAQPGELLLVYFGYTNCPDFCPTTLSNVKLARQQLDAPGRVDLAMITVDPDRDLPVLADYVTGFVPDAHALGTVDPAALARAAAPFFVTYEVREVDGETQVGHTTALYAVDDTGHVALTWPPDITIDDLAADLEQLLDDQ